MANVICGRCGADLPEDAKVCQYCGYSLDPNGASTANNSKNSLMDGNKKYIVFAAIAVVAVLFVVLLANIFSSSNYYYVDPDMKDVYIYETSEEVVILKEDSKVKIEGAGKASTIVLKDEVLVRATELDLEKDTENYTESIYTLDGKKIASNVISTEYSEYGNGIAMVIKVDDNNGNLVLWDDGETKTVCKEFNGDYTISPDGKSVAYTKYNDEGELYAYYWDGDVEEIGKNMAVFAISNDADLIYYRKNGKYYVQRGIDADDSLKLSENGIRNKIFNVDNTEIMFSVEVDNGYKSYVAVNGEEKIPLPGYAEDILLPCNAIGVYSFEGVFYGSDDYCYYIADYENAYKVISNLSQGFLADDEKTIVYRRGDSIYQIDGTEEDAEAEERVADDVNRIINATSDGKEIFYVSDGGEVMYQKGSRSAKRVATDYDQNYGSWAAFGFYDGDTLYYLNDGVLYYSDGDKGEKVKGCKLDTLIYVVASPKYIIVYDKDGSSYISFNGDDFKTIDK